MGNNIKKRTPKWYMDKSLTKTKKALFKMIKQGKTNDHIAEFFNATPATIRSFIATTIKDEADELIKTLPSTNLWSVPAGRRTKWLINNSRQETTEYITNQIFAGVSRKQISQDLSKMSGVNVTPGMIHFYIKSHVQIDISTSKVDEELNNENRFFSIHIVGSKPEALDRLRGCI